MNYTALNQFIDESGMKRSSIAQQLGMTPSQFTRRTRGAVDWKAPEIIAFSRLFKLTKAQRDNFFYKGLE